MTNEQAIEILRDTPIDIRSTREDDIHTLYAMAQNMAIEALSNSQNQTDYELKTTTGAVSEADVINRQDAIDAIDEIDWYHQNKRKEMVSGANPDDHQAWYKAEDVYKALESVPSAHLVNDSQGFSQGDYISRQDAINSIEKHLRFGDELYPLTDTDKVLNHAFAVAASCVYNLPSAQRTGEWIFKDHLWECNQCGCRINREHPLKGNIWNYNFCPNCGADCRGEKE